MIRVTSNGRKKSLPSAAAKSCKLKRNSPPSSKLPPLRAEKFPSVSDLKKKRWVKNRKKISFSQNHMNTNQEVISNADSPRLVLPFASEILQNVFGRKSQKKSDQLSQNISDANEKTENVNTANQILSRLENKKEMAAVNLSIGSDDVEMLPFDLSKLKTEGIFLNI